MNNRMAFHIFQNIAKKPPVCEVVNFRSQLGRHGTVAGFQTQIVAECTAGAKTRSSTDLNSYDMAESKGDVAVRLAKAAKINPGCGPSPAKPSGRVEVIFHKNPEINMIITRRKKIQIIQYGLRCKGSRPQNKTVSRIMSGLFFATML